MKLEFGGHLQRGSQMASHLVGNKSNRVQTYPKVVVFCGAALM